MHAIHFSYFFLNPRQMYRWQTNFYTCYTLGSNDIPVKVQYVSHPSSRELSVLHRISQLTGVLLEEELSTFGPTDHLMRIAPDNEDEVQWTRRALHEYVDKPTIIGSV